MSELKALARHLWPIAVGIAFSNKFDENARRKLLDSESFNALTQRPGATEQIDLIANLAETMSLTTLKDAEDVLEQSLSEDVKKNDGAVYTPEYIIDYILTECLSSLSPLEQTNATILDPACGSGGFLIGALRQVSSRTDQPLHAISQKLFGLDRNHEAVQNARLLLDLACLDSGGELSRATLKVCDTLLTPVEQQLDLIGQNRGVTILATNPPYVKLQTLDHQYRDQLTRKFPAMASGAFSLATLFIGQSTKYLHDGGLAGFITLNNLFTSLSGKALRQEWSRSNEVRKIVDFRHFPVFEASAYTCLLFLDKEPKSSVKFAAVNTMPNEKALSTLTFNDVPYSALNPEKWRLATERNLDLITRLENHGTRLSEAAEIKVGLATLFDKAFLCTLEGNRYVATGGDGIARTIEGGIVKKFTKISELSRTRLVSKAQRGVIYPYVKTSSALEPMLWDDILKEFPSAAEHLRTWKARLLARSGVKQEFWYQWGRRQSLISGPNKLFTKTFDRGPNFYLDESDGLFANGYSVRPSTGDSGYSIHQLKAFLESRFMHAYALVTSFEIEGGYQCYQKNYIENICLPPKDLLPTDADTAVEPRSEDEAKIANFYGIELGDLESCLDFYLN